MHALRHAANAVAPLRGPRVRNALQQLRFLNLQEYQSKEILDRHGCTVQRFFVAETTSEASHKLQTFSTYPYFTIVLLAYGLAKSLVLDCPEYVVKAQILAGGRGKGRFISGPPNLGGVFITTSYAQTL